ncbi:alpha/beta fold hydrolase [Streptomyces noursei]|uniref:alpha/beta fold hydrolase n=1 Tax=Streptomyces noursei TaxID=1971 RepID=UPI0016765592|nr:alpha/beta fold hydrolase [Streptomyces noursei]MCZ1014692.1 alpha/beta fold hydrolase [Streptomyces noursei]
MMHGLGLSGRYLSPVARQLAAAGRTVVVPDLPGSVRSRFAVRSMPDIPELAAALGRWHTAAGLGRCAVVAHSVGCQVSTAFAARHPELVSRMVLIGPALDPSAPCLWRQLGRLLADASHEPVPLVSMAVADYLVTGPVRFLIGFRRALGDAEGPYRQRLSEMDVPTLVIRGSGDTLAPMEWTRYAASLLPRGRVAVVHGAAHAAHFSAPESVAALIEDFLHEACEGAEGSPGRGLSHQGVPYEGVLDGDPTPAAEAMMEGSAE